MMFSDDLSASTAASMNVHTSSHIVENIFIARLFINIQLIPLRNNNYFSLSLISKLKTAVKLTNLIVRNSSQQGKPSKYLQMFGCLLLMLIRISTCIKATWTVKLAHLNPIEGVAAVGSMRMIVRNCKSHPHATVLNSV